jgi:hypothetical protein
MTTLTKLSLGAMCLLATAGAHAQNTTGDYERGRATEACAVQRRRAGAREVPS